jgi:hypothetical protein
MASHPIRIEVVEGENGERLIRAVPTLKVNEEDNVTWTFVDLTQGPSPRPLPLRVVFQAYLPTREREERFAIPTNGPFSEVIPSDPAEAFGPFTVSTATPNGLYIYSIFEGDNELKWETPAFTMDGFDGFFGTIQKPGGPPTAGSTGS